MSTASQSFTMKMENEARKAWNKSFNKLLNEPFGAQLSCVDKSRQVLKQGQGCVDMSDTEKMCCRSWKLNIVCDGGKWKQTTIDAEDCNRKKKTKPSPPPVGSSPAGSSQP